MEFSLLVGGHHQFYPCKDAFQIKKARAIKPCGFGLPMTESKVISKWGPKTAFPYSITLL